MSLLCLTLKHSFLNLAWCNIPVTPEVTGRDGSLQVPGSMGYTSEFLASQATQVYGYLGVDVLTYSVDLTS